MDISIHGTTEMRIAQHFPGNSNSIHLQFKSNDGTDEILIYGLPKSVTDKLLLALADDNTRYITSKPVQEVIDEEPEPLDAETIAGRDEYTERQIIEAGRGELVR